MHCVAENCSLCRPASYTSIVFAPARWKCNSRSPTLDSRAQCVGTYPSSASTVCGSVCQFDLRLVFLFHVCLFIWCFLPLFNKWMEATAACQRSLSDLASFLPCLCITGNPLLRLRVPVMQTGRLLWLESGRLMLRLRHSAPAG